MIFYNKKKKTQAWQNMQFYKLNYHGCMMIMSLFYKYRGGWLKNIAEGGNKELHSVATSDLALNLT